MKHAVMAMVEKDGVDPIIGCDNIRNKIEDAVQLFSQQEKPAVESKDPGPEEQVF